MIQSPVVVTQEDLQPPCQSQDSTPNPLRDPLRADSRSEKEVGLCGRSRCRTATCCVAATLLALVITAIVPLRAGAQSEAPSDNATDARTSSAQTSALRSEQAIETHLILREHIDAWRDVEPATLPAAPAARVALYRRGVIVGASAVLDESGQSISAAANAAMEETVRTLLPRRDASWREQIRSAAGELLLSLEIAGPLTPLAGEELDNPELAFRPGIDGIAVRVGNSWSLMFPSELAAAETTPRVEYPAMAARLLGDPLLGVELPRDLAATQGVTFYRFGVVHVAGVGEARVPAVLTRGGLVVGTGSITVRGLAAFAEEMLAHFEAAEIVGEAPLGIRGTFHPFRATAQPAIARPTQQALVALSLVELARTPQATPAVRERARALAGRLMQGLATTTDLEVAPRDDGVAMAIMWVVLHELGAQEEGSPLAGLFADAGEMMDAHAAAEAGEPSATVADAVLAWAMAERAARTGADHARAVSDLQAIYGAARPGGLVGLMPWLGWAELALAGEEASPAFETLRLVREQTWAHQVTSDDAGSEDADLVGGIVFTEGFVALPTWASARPLAIAATMLGDTRLTSQDEWPAEVTRLLAAMRFLRQLSPDATAAGFYPAPGLARGGVRASTWDHRMPPEATAMALLTVSEFLQSLAALEAAKDTESR